MKSCKRLFYTTRLSPEWCCVMLAIWCDASILGSLCSLEDCLLNGVVFCQLFDIWIGLALLTGGPCKKSCKPCLSKSFNNLCQFSELCWQPQVLF